MQILRKFFRMSIFFGWIPRNLSSLQPLEYSPVNISEEDCENTFGSNMEVIFIEATPFFISEHLNIFYIPLYF